MNRRKLLKGVLGVGVASVAGHAVADVADDDKYWEAQRLIDELHEAAEYMPMTHDGTDFRAALKASDVMDFSSAAIK